MNDKNNPIFDSEFLQMIKEFEGFESKPYKIPGDSWTIGYGHLIKKGETYEEISKEEAEVLLIKDLHIAYNSVMRHVPDGLNKRQIQALTSFVFNIGEGQFANSTMLKLLHKNEVDKAAAEFDRWVHLGENILPGLVIRRDKEKMWFTEKHLEDLQKIAARIMQDFKAILELQLAQKS